MSSRVFSDFLWTLALLSFMDLIDMCFHLLLQILICAHSIRVLP